MSKFLFTWILLFSASAFASDYTINDVKPFTSDGCTASPDGNWVHCCYEHDVAYWLGGTYEERLAADDRLKWCLNESNGPGYVYYDYVRAGGNMYWGRAWPDKNRNLNPTDEEIERIELERELWGLLNYPSNFDFVVYESIMYLPLTVERKALLKEKFAPIKTSAKYQDFYNTYINVLGEAPVIDSLMD